MSELGSSIEFKEILNKSNSPYPPPKQNFSRGLFNREKNQLNINSLYHPNTSSHSIHHDYLIPYSPNHHFQT